MRRGVPSGTLSLIVISSPAADSSSDVGGAQRDGRASSRGTSRQPKLADCACETLGQAKDEIEKTATSKLSRYIYTFPPTNFRARAETLAPLMRLASVTAQVYASVKTCKVRILRTRVVPRLPSGRRRALR